MLGWLPDVHHLWVRLGLLDVVVLGGDGLKVVLVVARLLLDVEHLLLLLILLRIPLLLPLLLLNHLGRLRVHLQGSLLVALLLLLPLLWVDELPSRLWWRLLLHVLGLRVLWAHPRL